MMLHSPFWLESVRANAMRRERRDRLITRCLIIACIASWLSAAAVILCLR